MTPQSSPKQAPGAGTQFSQLPSAVPSYFPECHRRSEISSLSKLKCDFSLGEKPEVLGIPRSASSSHTVTCWYLLIEDQTCSTFSGVLLVAGLPECGSLSTESPPSLKHLCHTFTRTALLHHPWKPSELWIVSVEECSSFTQNWMQICCSTYSVILNVMATQYTCSLNGIYHPQWLVQWSHHCSHMRIPVHSPWLPGYIEVTQTILIILTMARLFPDRPRICTNRMSAGTVDSQPSSSLKYFLWVEMKLTK